MSERDKISLKTAIFSLFEDVARQQDKRLGELSDDAPLNDIGLDSLCFAIIVARLEDTLGADPFSQSEELPFPTTVGAFVALYESCFA